MHSTNSTIEQGMQNIFFVQSISKLSHNYILCYSDTNKKMYVLFIRFVNGVINIFPNIGVYTETVCLSIWCVSLWLSGQDSSLQIQRSLVRVQLSPTFNKTLRNIFIFDSIANEAKNTFHITLAQTNKERKFMFLLIRL